MKICILFLVLLSFFDQKSFACDLIPEEENASSLRLKSPDLIPSLPRELILSIYTLLDDASLACTLRISKAYSSLEPLTEELFYQRSELKEPLALPFANGRKAQHSYFLRKSFWKLLGTLREKEIYLMTPELERLDAYYEAHHFKGGNLIKYIRSVDSNPIASLCMQNLKEAVLAQDSVALEMGTIMGIWGFSIQEQNNFLRFCWNFGPSDNDFSFQCYLNLCKASPLIFNFIMSKALENSEKAEFITDVVLKQTDNHQVMCAIYREATTRNNVIYQNTLGYKYYKGEDVPQDFTKAFKWLEKAAVQGNASAQRSLGIMYQRGQGIPQNDVKAFKWFKKAADQGEVIAQEYLGFIYQYGQGTPQDYAKAFRYYRKAAYQKDSVAQFEYGLMYFNGQGIPQNDDKAFKWYKKAANQEYGIAQNNLGFMYLKGRGTSQNDTKAFKWFKKAANQGHVVAQNNLGFMYRYGHGTSQNYPRAFKYYRKAAVQGNAEAQFNVGCMYLNGQGTPQDYAKTLKWLKKAVDQGHPRALEILNVVYKKGQDVEKL